LALDKVRRRLELTLLGIYGRHIAIAMPPAPRRSWMQKLTHRFSKAWRDDRTSTVDGDVIRLPIELPLVAGWEQTLRRYRLLALEQAERLIRGTVSLAPDEPLKRDLFLLREGARIDAAIDRSNPGMSETLAAERAAALALRPRFGSMSGIDRAVELMLRESLRPDALPQAGTAEESLAWARTTASSLRENGGSYRGIAAVPLWGSLPRNGGGEATPPDDRQQMAREAQVMQVGNSGARKSGTSGSQGEESEDILEDGKGKRERSGDPQSTDSSATSGVGAAPKDSGEEDRPPGIAYPEWSSTEDRYLRDAVMVRPSRGVETDAGWATQALHNHGALVRRIRHQFEKLRALPTRLDRQLAGEELDVRAGVDAFVDRRTGNSPSERLYIDSRAARRGVAIALLVDASGSTATKVDGDQTIIDVEKVAVLLASEAFDALGDLYTILTFSGTTAQDVRVTTLKDFAERNGQPVRRRVSAVTPAGHTRLGAAVRHATALLSKQSAGHRLLLILSDGRPNDVDAYVGSYGVEDSRRAIIEARASGVYAHCITVDREGAEYLPRIFGQAGHTILRRPSQLPWALLGVVKQLLRMS
jgi:nitric oxide reductase NorD protein